MKSVFERLQRTQPQLFSAADIVVPAAQLAAMAELIAAIERVFALPAYRAQVLAQAPEIARLPCAPRGVFYGYDFHLGTDGPRLIEINTNAGGGLLNAYLLAAHGRDELAAAAKQAIVDMFREEWRLARGAAPLRRIAIVDEAPAGQFLAPEFALFVELFAEHGIDAVIADPGELQRVVTADGERLLLAGEEVDLVYARLTDFYLETPACTALRQVFAAGGVVVTPHPQAHALYADKRNLMLLSDPQALAALGVDAATSACLQRGVPQTVTVNPENGEKFWSERKRWFFKPPAGFGSRAAYRGDKLTKRVFEEILAGDYIAQEIAPPSEHPVPVGDETVTMKADFRCYVYAGQIQQVVARLYQGQTTNFRTAGGGFAPVFAG